MKLAVAPLTPERWPDLEAIFNAKGCSVARGCWCMYYRRSGSRGPLPSGTTHAQANRVELKALVDEGKPPGLIGYRGKVPVGWVSVGPREEYAKLKRSPTTPCGSGQSPCTTALVSRRSRVANRSGPSSASGPSESTMLEAPNHRADLLRPATSVGRSCQTAANGA